MKTVLKNSYFKVLSDCINIHTHYGDMKKIRLSRIFQDYRNPFFSLYVYANWLCLQFLLPCHIKIIIIVVIISIIIIIVRPCTHTSYEVRIKELGIQKGD